MSNSVADPCNFNQICDSTSSREISRAAGKAVPGIIDEDNSGNDSQ